MEGDGYTYLLAYPKIMEAMNHLDNPFAAALLDELKIIAGTAPAPPSAPTQVRVQVEDTIVGTVRDPSVVL